MKHRLLWMVALASVACDDAGGGIAAAFPDVSRADSEVDGGPSDGTVGDGTPDDSVDRDAAPPDMAPPDPDMMPVVADMAPPDPDAAPPPADPCAPLPPIPEDAVVVTPDDVGNLRNVVRDLEPGATLVFEVGNYALDGDFLRIDIPGVTVRGRTGRREDVVLDGEYSSLQIINVFADDVTIADLTLRRAFNHAVHVVGGADGDTDRTRLVNLAVIDAGQQGIKINGNNDGTTWTNDGLIACSLIELTDEGRPNIRDDCYTGGIDAHGARGWTVSRNDIRGFWCAAGLSEHGIHFWRASRDTLIERNLLLNNARGVGFGLGFSGADDGRVYDDPPECGEGSFGHYEGIIRNNFVAAEGRVYASASGVDVGIGLESVCAVKVIHNSVAFSMAPRSSAIEWRFEHTQDVLLANNLTSHRMNPRNDANARSLGNVQMVGVDVFTDVAAGDLHLTPDAMLDPGGRLAVGVADDDFDGDPRTDPRDVGADERE